MPKDDRRLGKGLAALLSENLEEGPSAGDRTVPVSAIRPNPFQPRAEFDPETLGELARSIRSNGLLQPIVVRPLGDAFQIVAGERRFRAIQSLEWDSVPAVVRTLTDEEMLVIALVENLQRENLSPLDEAQGYRQLVDDFGLTQEDVGRHVGRDRSTVSNALRLLGLPEPVQRLLAEGRLSAGHARAILGLTDSEQQTRMATRAVAEGWSVRDTERRVRSGRPSGKPPQKRARPTQATDPVTRRAELVLERGLGTQVRIRTGTDGAGAVVIQFHDTEDFFRLVERMAGERVAAELRE